MNTLFEDTFGFLIGLILVVLSLAALSACATKQVKNINDVQFGCLYDAEFMHDCRKE